jgi:hypothetical protein
MSSSIPVNQDSSVRDESHSPLEDASSLANWETPPMIERAQAAFRRDLPQLLKDYKGRWVAYHGDRQVGLGRSKRELFQRCLRQGLPRNEFVVRSVEPEMAEEIDWNEVRDL